jgi:diguanylate cyclase
MIKRERVSILMIDIDNFKNYNDRLGHQQGDKLLREAGNVLKKAIGERDYIARYGGEEFIVLCHAYRRDELRALADKLCRAVSEHPFPMREVQPGKTLSISVGISTSRKADANLQELIAEADAALYQSKSTGKNKFSFFSDIA